MNRKAEENFLKYLTETPQKINFYSKSKGTIKNNVQLFEKLQIQSLIKSQSKIRTFTEETQKCYEIISKAKQAIEKLKQKKNRLNLKVDMFEQISVKKQELFEEKTSQSYSYSTASSSFANTYVKKAAKKGEEEYIFVNNYNQIDNIIAFKIIKFLNQGFFGKVYLVQEMKTKTIYSIKIIPRNVIKKGQEHNLIRQIKIQSFLNHPNIIKLYNFFLDEENIYLVMEPFLGKDLYAAIKNQKIGFGENEVKGIIKQVVSAVEYMHKENIMHRDLKPENILYCDNIVKICDFGWSIYSSDLRKTLCGTPLYTSPEMLKQESYNQKIDIWSLGLLTYELLMEKPPFQIKNINSLNNILTQEVTFPDSKILSQNTKDFIIGCTKKEHRLRFNINDVKRHEFLQSSKQYRCTIQ